MDFKDAVTLVKDNGGIPVIAHPGVNFRGKEKLIRELFVGGAQGLEVFNNYHSLKQSTYFADLVMQEKYLMTCGSDFHGKTKPLIGLGEYSFRATYEEYFNNSIKKIVWNR